MTSLKRRVNVNRIKDTYHVWVGSVVVCTHLFFYMYKFIIINIITVKCNDDYQFSWLGRRGERTKIKYIYYI